MSEITREAFTAADETSDWGIVISGPCALYRTQTYRSAIELVDAVAGLATDDLQPEFEIRSRAVLVRLPAPDRRIHSSHLELAQAITRVARQHDATPDPSGIQDVQIALDAADEDAARAFWGAALGFDPMRHSHLRSRDRIGPTFFINDKPYRPPRNRFHVDVSLPPSQAQARVDAILAAGGHMLGDRYAPEFWSLIDTEGNVVDLATWQGRDPGD
ncbi:MAG: VOC family protein [Pseudolysinimonas sp.]